jgi:hypothetical protein
LVAAGVEKLDLKVRKVLLVVVVLDQEVQDIPVHKASLVQLVQPVLQVLKDQQVVVVQVQELRDILVHKDVQVQ